jgi:hypothetical protein
MAHWLFSFNYFEMVNFIPYAIENKKVPKKTKICLDVYFWGWISILSVVGVLCGIVAHNQLEAKYEMMKALILYP